MNNYSYQQGNFMPYQNNGVMPNYGQQPFNPQQTMFNGNNQQFQQPMQPQFSQPFKTNIEYVNGIEGAKAFVLPPNSKLLLMDSDDTCFYIKTTDMQGKPTIKVFPYVDKEKESQEKNNQLKNIESPSIEQFNNFYSQFETFKSQMVEQVNYIKKSLNENKEKVNEKQ